MPKNSLNTKGFGLIGVLVLIVALAVVAGGGVYVYHQNHKAKTTASTTTSHTSTSGKTSTATDPYAGWSQYCSAQEKSCFKYPTTWTTKNVGAVDPTGDGIQLTSPNGTVIWFQSAVSGLGGACQPGTPDVFNHKVIPAPHVANLYIVESGSQSTINHIGLVDGSNGKGPQTGDTGSCVGTTTFTSKHDSSVYAWLESNGTDNLKANDLSTAELILQSYNYQ
jgi:Tfp pilus assembly major pilin PilA